MAIRGIVINPVNRQLLLSRGHKSEVRLHNINSWSVNAELYGEATLTHSPKGNFTCLERGNSNSEYVSKFPRAHPILETKNIGKGYGTATYAACCIAGLYDKPNVRLDNYGISSSPYYRSDDSTEWWNKAIKRGVAENVAEKVKYCKEGYISELPDKIKKELYKHISEKETDIESVNDFTINYKAVPKQQERFEYQILRTSSAISAGWIGLYTTSLTPTIIENLDSSNTVLCNLHTFINANWSMVEPEVKSILFNLILDLAQLKYPEKDLAMFEKAVFGRR